MRFYCFNIAVDNLSEKEALSAVIEFLKDKRQHYIVTPNPEIVLTAMRDKYFREALLKSDLALADGYGLFMAMRFAGCYLKERLTGTDFLNTLLLHLPANTSFFFLGGEGGVAELAALSAKRMYGAKIVGTYEPRRGVYDYSTEEIFILDIGSHQSVIDEINEKAPQVLVVALGHGLQEKWLYKFLKECPSVKVGMGVGGALDYLGNRARRAPNLIRAIGLEWLWRLTNEPQRWPRILNATVVFPLKAVGWLMSMSLKYRPLSVGCIINKNGEVLLVKRVDVPGHWQLPQGGREPGESSAEAVMREMSEEVGLINLHIIGQTKKNVYKYRWPKKISTLDSTTVASRLYHGYAGQSATVFYLKFNGAPEAVKIDQREISAFKWVPLNKLLQSVHPVRRSLVKIILQDLRRLALDKINNHARP